jgi:small-conductance mechanosensitive channel
MRIILLLFFLALVSPPTLSLAQDAPVQPSGEIGIENSATHDAAIAVRIRSILSELEGYGDVTVTVKSGIVTLRGTTLDTPTALRLNELVGRVNGVVAIENEVGETTDVVERLNPLVKRTTLRIQQALNYLPLLLIALLAFLGVTMLGFMLARMKQPWNRIAPNSFIADIYRQLLRIAFVIAGIVVALDILGATALLSTILGAAGIIGLAIGFAVRDTVENFIASIMLSIRQPFQPNDAVEIGGAEGKVIRLTSRATVLLSYDGNHIRIPNSKVFSSQITNFSRNPERRFKFSIGVGYGTDLAYALQLAHDTLNALPYVLDSPAVAVWIEEMGGSDISLTITGWINQTETGLLSARSEAIRLTLDAFENAGIEMPEPTYRLLTDIQTPVSPASQTPPVTKAKASHTDARPGTALDVNATSEQELENIVEEERKTTKSEDLLDRDSPEE